MPTYEYECRACGHRFEHFQSMTSKKLRKCPDCEQRKLIRLVGSGAGLIFKGSGFYETDYKRAGSDAGSDAGSKSEGDASGASSGSEGGSSSKAGDKPSKSGGSDD